MKHESLKHALLSAVVLLAVGHASIAYADTQRGSLGKSAEAIDLYRVTCFDNGGGTPARLEAHLQDLVPARVPLLSVQLLKENMAANSTDRKTGEGSPEVSLNGGDGDYYVLVNKTKKGLKSYELDFHCITSANVHSGTSVEPLQDQ
jgi:hypothetical protein